MGKTWQPYVPILLSKVQFPDWPGTRLTPRWIRVVDPPQIHPGFCFRDQALVFVCNLDQLANQPVQNFLWSRFGSKFVPDLLFIPMWPSLTILNPLPLSSHYSHFSCRTWHLFCHNALLLSRCLVVQPLSSCSLLSCLAVASLIVCCLSHCISLIALVTSLLVPLSLRRCLLFHCTVVSLILPPSLMAVYLPLCSSPPLLSCCLSCHAIYLIAPRPLIAPLLSLDLSCCARYLSCRCCSLA